jgi:hypothetical protein
LKLVLINGEGNLIDVVAFEFLKHFKNTLAFNQKGAWMHMVAGPMSAGAPVAINQAIENYNLSFHHLTLKEDVAVEIDSIVIAGPGPLEAAAFLIGVDQCQGHEIAEPIQ